MPTLIRLLGDSAKNTTEVRNTFKEPVYIPANARIALTGLNCVLADDLANETFVISGTIGEFKIGLATTNPLAQPLAVIPAGDYTAASFVDAFEVAANYTGSQAVGSENSDLLLGLHHITDIVDGKLQLKSYLGENADTDFDDAIWTDIGENEVGLRSVADFTATAVADSSSTLLNTGSIVPLVSSKFAATLVNPETVDMLIAAVRYKDTSTVLWGVRVITDGAARRYQYGYKPLVGSTIWENILSATAEANDVVELFRFGEAARVKINRSNGDNVANLARTGIDRALTDPSNGAIQWLVQANTDGEMVGCTCTKIDGLSPQLSGLNSSVDASLQFANNAGKFNGILALYCGFANERNKIIYRGDPATLISRTEIGGVPGYPGILVTIDGLGLLKSFDGAAVAKSPANIIYSVNELQDKNQYLQLDVPQPLYLDIGNAAPINVNELRVRLFEAGGFNQLTFIGKPSFSFIIDYPKKG